MLITIKKKKKLIRWLFANYAVVIRRIMPYCLNAVLWCGESTPIHPGPRVADRGTASRYRG